VYIFFIHFFICSYFQYTVFIFVYLAVLINNFIAYVKNFNEGNKKDFISKYIDLFSSLYIPKDSWLTDREKEYFIAHVMLNFEKRDLLSKDVKNVLKEDYNFKNRGVDIYRKKLKDKGWIIQTKEGIKLPPAFDYNGKKFPNNLKFQFKLSWKE